MSDLHGDLSDPQVFFFDELSSTNQKMKELADRTPLPDFSLVITRYQYAGRGQMGNSWESEADKNLTFSVALNPQFLKIQEQFVLSQAVSVALVKALALFHIEQVKVKWPNDIYVGDNKIAGILIETSIVADHLERCTIGIGLNVNQTCFRSNAPNPISMAQVLNKQLSLKEVLTIVNDQLVEYYSLLAAGQSFAVRNAYLSLLYRHDGAFHSFRDAEGVFEGLIIGIDPYGRLMVQRLNGQISIYDFKEVAYL
jgi:BirA family transcriptional regulator, biotin operon repressor / biotin---[acetyl-CoA-carboxylase] ligase